MIRFSCPACGTAYKVPDEVAGRGTKCRKCRNPLVVPMTGLVPVKDPARPLTGLVVHPSPVAVLIEAHTPACPCCSSSMSVYEEHIGVWLQCPHCKKDILPLTCERAVRVFPKVDNCYFVKVSARLLHWPPKCVCCVSDADTETNITHTRSKAGRNDTRGWPAPICRSCLGHCETMGNALRFPEPDRCRRILADMGLRMRAGCCTVMAPAVYDGWNGSVQYFRFVSPGYARLFIEANKSKIVAGPYLSKEG